MAPPPARSPLRLATLVALSACCYLAAGGVLPLAEAAPAPSPAAPPPGAPPPSAGAVVYTPPPRAANPPTPSVRGRLAAAQTVVVGAARTVGRKVLAIGDTRLDQLFVSKKAEEATPAGSRAAVEGGTPAGKGSAAATTPPAAAPSPAAVPPPPVAAAGGAGSAAVVGGRDRAADWAAAGLVLLFLAIAMGILAPIVRGVRERKTLLPGQADVFAVGEALR